MEKVTKRSSTDDIATHPCTGLDIAIVVLPLQQLSLDT